MAAPTVGLGHIEQDHALANSDTSPGVGIAGLQLDLAPGDNLERIASEVAQVARRFPWVRMVLLGELCGFRANTAHAQCLPGDAEENMRSAARHSAVWLVPCSPYERDGAAVLTHTTVIAHDGQEGPGTTQMLQ